MEVARRSSSSRLGIPQSEVFGTVVFAFAFRFGCFALMVWLALGAESRPAPSLPDAVLARVPYVAWVDRFNFLLWALGYVPVAIALWLFDVKRFCRYMVTSGWLSLARGVCIAVTGLGPVNGADVNVGMSSEQRIRAFLALISPIGVFFRNVPHAYLTKDLFFSGHTATTALLLFYVWKFPRLRWPMLFAHLLVVASVFFAHLHYTIDVLGAYACAFSLFVLREHGFRTVVR